jgi:hypothetical protein
MLTLTLLVLLSGSAGESVPPEWRSLSPDQAQIALDTLRGFRDSRERLRSGVFRIAGEKHEELGPESPIVDGPVEYSCAFDFAQGKIRMDVTDLVFMSAAIGEKLGLERFDGLGKSSGTKAARTLEPGQAFFRQPSKFVRTSEYTLAWSGWGAHQILRRSPHASPPEQCSLFDVRCLGLISTADLDQSKLQYTEFSQRLMQQQVIDAAIEENGLHRIVWKFGNGIVSWRTVWFSRENGYSPVRIQFHCGENRKLVQSGETTWQEVSSVWVPKTLRLKTEGTRRLEINWAFKWESVNTSVDSRRFTEEGLDVPGRVWVIDTELASPVRTAP